MGDHIHIDLVMGRTLVFVVGLEGDHCIRIYMYIECSCGLR